MAWSSTSSGSRVMATRPATPSPNFTRFPSCTCGATPVVRLLKRGAWKPDAAEVAANRRAESARLRAVEKLAPPTTPEEP